MRRRKILLLAVWFLGALVLYVSTFSYWWLTSPTKELVIQGHKVHEVQFTYNKVSYYTGPIWIPAFWFMQHVCGYEEVGFIAMYEKSIMVYSK